MVLIWEVQEAAVDAPQLEDVECGQALGDRQSEVQVVVDDQVRRGPVVKVSRRIPLLVDLTVLPQRSAEVVMWEEQLLGRVLVQGAEDAVVRHEGLELPSKRVPLDPVYHVSAVRSAQGDGPRGINVGEVAFDVFEAFNEILVRLAAPIVFDAILERHTISAAARGIGGDDDVALLSEDSRVPSGRPAIIPCTLGLL